MAVEKVSGGQTHGPADHVARTAGCHLPSYRLGQVGGAPPWHYKSAKSVELPRGTINTPPTDES
jgi:hypothetical protein